MILKNKNLLVTGGSKGIGFSTLISLYNDIYIERNFSRKLYYTYGKIRLGKKVIIYEDTFHLYKY